MRPVLCRTRDSAHIVPVAVAAVWCSDRPAHGCARHYACLTVAPKRGGDAHHAVQTILLRYIGAAEVVEVVEVAYGIEVISIHGVTCWVNYGYG